MPELPEVETIKRELKPNVIGKIISEITVLSPKNFVGKKEAAYGCKITKIERFGKVLVMALDNNKYLNAHFKLSGQMLFAKKIGKAVFKNNIPFTRGNVMPANTTRIIIKFKDGGALFFNDLRKFGWIKLTDRPESPKGVDVLSKKFTPEYLFGVLRLTRKPVKVTLMDQDRITGIGNIYANDSLFKSKIHPQKISNSISSKETDRLHKSILEEIYKGIRDQGSSGADEAFILPDGSKGKHQRHFLVYQRERQPCINCKTIIKRIKHNGRSSYFCPNCQKI